MRKAFCCCSAKKGGGGGGGPLRRFVVRRRASDVCSATGGKKESDGSSLTRSVLKDPGKRGNARKGGGDMPRGRKQKLQLNGKKAKVTKLNLCIRVLQEGRGKGKKKKTTQQSDKKGVRNNSGSFWERLGF